MRGLDDGPDGLNEAAFDRAMSQPSPRFEMRICRGELVRGRRGWSWEIRDTGRLVRHGWTDGKKSDAKQDATRALTELRSKEAA